MEYKLFEEFITLQALLKELGIIQSGGAIKPFLMEHQVYFNGELETRRGKKIRIGDEIDIPDLKIDHFKNNGNKRVLLSKRFRNSKTNPKMERKS